MDVAKHRKHEADKKEILKSLKKQIELLNSDFFAKPSKMYTSDPL